MADTTIIRIDPFKRTAAKLRVTAGRSIRRDLARIVRCPVSKLGTQFLLNVPTVSSGGVPAEIPLMTVASIEIDEDAPGWRLKGTVDTSGIAVLCGGNNDLVVPVPVDVNWVMKRIVWMKGEDLSAVAAEVLPACNDAVREALRGSRDLAEMFFVQEAHYPHRDDLVALGLAEDHGGLAKLTRLGEHVRTLALAEAAH